MKFHSIIILTCNNTYYTNCRTFCLRNLWEVYREFWRFSHQIYTFKYVMIIFRTNYILSFANVSYVRTNALDPDSNIVHWIRIWADTMLLSGDCFAKQKVQRKSLYSFWLGLGNKYRFLDINRFSFLQTDIDS